MEKSVEFVEDEDESNGMSNGEMVSARSKMRESLNSNASTFKNYVDNMYKYSLSFRQ